MEIKSNEREKDAKLILVLTSAKIEFFGRENFAKLALFLQSLNHMNIKIVIFVKAATL